ncbi:unnamed protein product [Caenorhabditis auriculariae]|uniref:Guanine nucleotide-binding protein subunit gamma n=1 Tax=Caenorhabditis auriculariae TaxID=2777116 RepID=A0A8S1H9P1_9PELO|nr:unnamed protein product [Caenorhabditis auriculariae]
MDNVKAVTQQLRLEVNTQRKKVSEVSGDLISFCEKNKQDDMLVSGTSHQQNPYEDTKSCIVFCLIATRRLLLQIGNARPEIGLNNLTPGATVVAFSHRSESVGNLIGWPRLLVRLGLLSFRQHLGQVAGPKPSVMDNVKTTTEQLRVEAQIVRKKVSEASKDLIDFCEKNKGQDMLVSGPNDQNNPFKEKKSCSVL